VNKELLRKIEIFINTAENSDQKIASVFTKRDLENLQTFSIEADYYFNPERYEELETLEEIA